LFDDYVLSYQHGAMKPNAAIYAVVETITGRKGPDLIYLDDRAENVDAGTARGWRTILHSSPSKSRETLKSFGLPV
jgi:HAD superfamily hydrolase (TIGR01509 family)